MAVDRYPTDGNAKRTSNKWFSSPNNPNNPNYRRAERKKPSSPYESPTERRRREARERKAREDFVKKQRERRERIDRREREDREKRRRLRESAPSKAAMRKGFFKIARMLGGAALKANPYTGAFSWAWDAYDIAGNVYGWATDSQGVPVNAGPSDVPNPAFWLQTAACEGPSGYGWWKNSYTGNCGLAAFSINGVNRLAGDVQWSSDLLAFTRYNEISPLYANVADSYVLRDPDVKPAEHQMWASQPLPPVVMTDVGFEFPMEWPYPQSWSDAVALPGSQPDGSPEPEKQPSRRDAQQATQRVPVVAGVRVLMLPDLGVVPVTDTQLIVVGPGPLPVQEDTIPPPRTVSRPLKDRRNHRRPPIKERKVRMSPLQAGIWASLNFATEGVDFLFVLHDALPKKYQAKRKSGWSKAAAHDAATAVYVNWPRIDVGKAIENYVNEWMEDMFYAGLGRAGKNLNQLTGAPTGGGRALNNNASEFGEDNPVKPPEMTLDVETGHWQVETPFGFFYGSLGG